MRKHRPFQVPEAINANLRATVTVALARRVPWQRTLMASEGYILLFRLMVLTSKTPKTSHYRSRINRGLRPRLPRGLISL